MAPSLGVTTQRLSIALQVTQQKTSVAGVLQATQLATALTVEILPVAPSGENSAGLGVWGLITDRSEPQPGAGSVLLSLEEQTGTVSRSGPFARVRLFTLRAQAATTPTLRNRFPSYCGTLRSRPRVYGYVPADLLRLR